MTAQKSNTGKSPAEPTPEALAELLDSKTSYLETLLSLSASWVRLRLLFQLWRIGQQTPEELQDMQLPAKEALDTNSDRQVTAVLDAYRDYATGTPGEYDPITTALLNLKAQAVFYAQVISDKPDDAQGTALRELSGRLADDAAHAINLEGLPAGDLLQLLRFHLTEEELQATDNAVATEDLISVATGQWSRAMQEGIIRRTDLQPFDKKVAHKTGRKRLQSLVRVDARLDPADFDTYPHLQAETPQQEKLLADMRLTLAGWKEHNAALLKLHLDLTDMAYQAARTTGEERPEFIYHLGEALERQGYARNDKRRGYHPDTLQGLRQRLEALYSHRVAAWATTPDRKQLLARSPYWIMEEEYSVRQLPLDLDVVPALAAGSGNTDTYTAVRIRPGRWWEYAEMSERRYPLPGSILRLPTDGRGRERERYALLISTFLALHVRRNQRQHAGKTVILKTGTLLEEAGITTWEEFDQMHPTQASRMRDHLHHSSEETGVFPLLRELDAFDVRVIDQGTFYASGRGWRPKFWEARLEIQIPSMGIIQKKKRGKRSN